MQTQGGRVGTSQSHTREEAFANLELHLKILNKLDYVFDHQVLSTQDFAIPQSRSRVYILAVAKEICAGTVKLPEKRSEKVDLHHFIQKDKSGSEVLQLPRYEELLGSKMWRKGYILDVGSSENFKQR